VKFVTEKRAFDLHVRGAIPAALSGRLIIAASRRDKDRRRFSRWHDSQADLIRLDLTPGKPGRIRAEILSVDPFASDVGDSLAEKPFYVAQPNHGLNWSGDTVWATNLLFGAPLEIDLERWEPRRVLRCLAPHSDAPQISSTSHFAWSLDRHHAYFHQSLLERDRGVAAVQSAALSLVQLDVSSGATRLWPIVPPPNDADLRQANFHSAFYFEEFGKAFVGLLRTGAMIECLAPHEGEVGEHVVTPMSASTIWIIAIEDEDKELHAELLPGIRELGGLALSHLDVDNRSRNGFVLYANYKQADVAEETHGVNIYGEQPERVTEHYSGMTVEAINFGQVIRYERREGSHSIRTFRRPYDPLQTSRGHSWLPINIELDSTRQRLFCSFAGFRPRLLPQHIAAAYPDLVVDPARIRYIPPLLMRLDPDTLLPQYESARTYLSYAEPVAFTAAGNGTKDFVCTFSSEAGLRIYAADDFSRVLCHAVSPMLMNWRDSHFRPDPAHMVFCAC
jgi:hypothetical protein